MVCFIKTSNTKEYCILMNITNLYVKTHKELQELDYTKFTPQQIMEKMDLNIRYYLEIERDLEDEETEIVTLDYSLLCLETDIGKCKTWEEDVYKRQV